MDIMVKLAEISKYLSTFKVKKIVCFDNFLPILVVLLTVSPSLSADNSSTDSCLLKLIKEAKNDKTIGAIRTECSARFSKKKRNAFLLDSVDNTEPDGDPIARRIELEEGTELNPFVLTAHKPNYLLPFAHNFNPNDEPFLSELQRFRVFYIYSPPLDIIFHKAHACLSLNQWYWSCRD